MPFFSIWLTGLVLVVVVMTLVWLVSIKLTNASIVDLCWGMLFVMLGWWYFRQTSGSVTRSLLVMLLVTIWGVRLSLYLTWRNWGKGEDFRYQKMRQHYGAERYWWISFFQVFMLQGVLAWLVSLPLLGAQFSSTQPQLNWLDGLAVIVWLLGFMFEAGGDWQLARFKANPANKGKVLRTGLWKYTRHPNYFGDSMIWWSYGLFCLANSSYLPVIGSLLMTILIIRVSGVSLLERTLKYTKPEYAEYIATTSAFLPLPPRKRN